MSNCFVEALNRRPEFKILWATFRSPIAELWFLYDRTIAVDCRRSQRIADDRRRQNMVLSSAIVCYGSIFCDRLRSSAITIAGSKQTIAEVCFHMIADYRRRSQNILRSAIRDPRSSAIIRKPALMCSMHGQGQ